MNARRLLFLYCSSPESHHVYQSDERPTTLVRPIPLVPIYALCSFLSVVTVTLSLRFGQSARTALLSAGFLFAVIAVVCFARFLVAADELFKDINYRALIFGFVSSLSLALVLDFFCAVSVPTFRLFRSSEFLSR